MAFRQVWFQGAEFYWTFYFSNRFARNGKDICKYICFGIICMDVHIRIRFRYVFFSEYKCHYGGCTSRTAWNCSRSKDDDEQYRKFNQHCSLNGYHFIKYRLQGNARAIFRDTDGLRRYSCEPFYFGLKMAFTILFFISMLAAFISYLRGPQPKWETKTLS